MKGINPISLKIDKVFTLGHFIKHMEYRRNEHKFWYPLAMNS